MMIGTADSLRSLRAICIPSSPGSFRSRISRSIALALHNIIDVATAVQRRDADVVIAETIGDAFPYEYIVVDGEHISVRRGGCCRLFGVHTT